MTVQYNAIDADGHVLEPPDLWTSFIDPKFREQAPRVVVGDDGYEWFSIGGRMMGGTVGLSGVGAVGVPVEDIRKMRYADGRKGGFEPHARIKDLDLDGIDAVFLYPTLGLFSGVLTDADLSAAVCRAYNRWIAEYCKPYPDRLFGVAMLPMQSVPHAVEELRFARNQLGLRAGFLRPNPYNDRLLSSPDYDPIWREAQELDFAMSLHEGTGGKQAVAADRVDGYPAKHIAAHPMEMMLASLNLIWGGVCERFPKVRFAFLECGGGWMVPWLDRMDRHYGGNGVFRNPALKMKPSEYFRRQCWISFEPVEVTIAGSAEHLGANKLLWATDYPHGDGYFPGAPQMVAKRLPPARRRDVMAQGAIEFYGLR
jgi:predicted TIM-barrel fold metal-dependent hydrolase